MRYRILVQNEMSGAFYESQQFDALTDKNAWASVPLWLGGCVDYLPDMVRLERHAPLVVYPSAYRGPPYTTEEVPGWLLVAQGHPADPWPVKDQIITP